MLPSFDLPLFTLCSSYQVFEFPELFGAVPRRSHATMVPDTKPEDGYSFDSMHPEAEAVVAEKKGGTSIDGYEMGRMGKKQELRVSLA